MFMGIFPDQRMSDSLVVATVTGLVSQRRRVHSSDMAEGKDSRRRWTKVGTFKLDFIQLDF